jgi:hypothetical protein
LRLPVGICPCAMETNVTAIVSRRMRTVPHFDIQKTPFFPRVVEEI